MQKYVIPSLVNLIQGMTHYYPTISYIGDNLFYFYINKTKNVVTEKQFIFSKLHFFNNIFLDGTMIMLHSR